MAYGLLLYKEIISPEGVHRLEVHKDGFAGQAVEIDGLVRDSIVLSKNAGEVSDAIVTSVLSFGIYDTGQIDYTQFFTPNATLFKVVLKLDGTTRWTGFLTPDSYSENLAYRDIITLTARDNLGRLNDYDFDLAEGQLLSIRAIINAGLSVAGVAMGVTYTTAKVATSPTTTLAVDGLVNTSLLAGGTWHEALDTLLTGIGCTLAWNEGNAFEVRDISQAPTASQAAYFVNKSGYRQIRPAWKNITLEQDYGLRDNFYEGRLTQDDCGSGTTFTIPATSRWAQTGQFSLLNPWRGAGNPLETIYLPIQGGDALPFYIAYDFGAPQMAAPIRIAFRGNNTAWIWQTYADMMGDPGIRYRADLITSQTGSVYRMSRYFVRFRVNVFCTVGSTTYVLRDGWQVYDPTSLQQTYLAFVMPSPVTDSGEIGTLDADNDVEIYLGQVPANGTVSLVFYTPVVQKVDGGAPCDVALAVESVGNNVVPYAKITNIEMRVDDDLGGRKGLVTVNADHNVQSSLAVKVGQVPTGRGNVLNYLGGLFADDTYKTPLTAFNRDGNGPNFDLLELVGREHISFNNAAYSALSGSMMAAAAFRFDKGITFEETDYRIVAASLAVLSNTLNAQMLQQEAEFDTAAYTMTTVEEEGGRSSSRTGSIAQGGAFGVDWFVAEEYEVDGQTRRRLKLNPAYAGMYAEGWIVAGGQGSGSGEAGSSLEGLVDVTIANKQPGDILRYNDLTAHWENTPLALTLADLTNVSNTTPSNGQALVYDSNLGEWKPGNVGGGGSVEVISADATIGTSLTTLGTVNGVAIKAKIAAYLEISQFTASNIVTVLGNTAVNYATRATEDASGNTIKTFYAANLVYYNGELLLKNGNNTTISTITGANILGMLGLQSTDTIATTAWVGNQGFLTASAISDMATKTWVGQQGYLTSSAISDMATKTWVGQQGYLTSASLSGYMLASDYTGNGTSVVSRAKADESGNVIKTYYAANLIVSGTDLLLKNGSNTTLSTITGANIVTVIGNNAVARATADANGKAFTSSYLRKDTDDTMSANLTIGASNSAKSLMVYGSGTFSTSLNVGTDATIGGNTTIGAKTSTSTAKALSVYGRNNRTNPALNIYGVYGNNSAYLSSLYTASDGLHITTALNVAGNITATGNIVAGTASDRRLKDHIKTMGAEQAIGVLKALRPVTFEWNDLAGELGGFSGDSRGFVADEYNRIIGNATRKIWGTYDAIDYQQAIPYLVAGWQALYEEVQRLKRRLGDGI